MVSISRLISSFGGSLLLALGVPSRAWLWGASPLRRPLRRLDFIGIGFVLLIAANQGCADKRSEVACKDCNVILMVVDTLRADHLGSYGYERATSPNLDEFANRSAVFENARSQAACTFPSVASLLTARSPDAFVNLPDRDGQREKGIPSDIVSLPEILQKHGYSTFALSGSPIVRDASNPSRHNKIGGYEKGFDRFETLNCVGEDCVRPHKPHAEQVNQSAKLLLDSIKGKHEPFFLYLHYMDVHDPYSPPGDEYRKFGSEYKSDLDWVNLGSPNPISKMLFGKGPKVDYTDADLQHLIDLYDNEIFYFDTQFRELQEILKEAGLLEDTIQIIVSDHGEAFLDHGLMKHCKALYDPEIYVPLIFHSPKVIEPVRSSQPAGLVDVPPTVLDYLGLPKEDYGFDGRSLRQASTGEAGVRSVYSAQHKYRSVFDGKYKLILNTKTNEYQLYDVEGDSLEQTNIHEPTNDVAARLRDDLMVAMGIEEEADEKEELEKAAEIGRSTQEHLRAIGYLE